MPRLCLVVDDSVVTRSVGRRIVEELGFECAEAADGDKALTLCRTRMPDVVLLDWNMPHLSGYDFMLALRALPDSRDTVIIFCTTESEKTQIVKAIEHGADEYIIKPFDSDTVRDKFLLTGVLTE